MCCLSFHLRCDQNRPFTAVPSGRRTSKQAGQASRQTGRKVKASRQAVNRDTMKESGAQTSSQTGMQADSKDGRNASRQEIKQPGKQKDKTGKMLRMGRFINLRRLTV